MSKNKKKTINPYLLLIAIIALCVVVSYFITPGAYDRVEINGKIVVDPNSYHPVERTPLSLFDFFRSFAHGFTNSSSLIFIIFMMGAVVQILQVSGALDAGINALITKYKDRGEIVIWMIMLVYSLIGGFLGTIEAMISFSPVVVAVILALGYDGMTAGAVIILGLMVSFSVGPTNISTVGVAHSIADLKLFSGFGFRLVMFVIFVLTAILYTIRYARKVKKNPELSLTKGIDVSDITLDTSKLEGAELTLNHKLSLLGLVAMFVIMLYGMLRLSWGVTEMSALFIIFTLAVAIINKMGIEETTEVVISGMKSSMSGALIISVARSIQWALENGGIIDPVLHALSYLLSGFSPFFSAVGIVIVVALLNGLVPSGSGKAVALMPLIIPLADLIGLTRQTAILAYQFGDGITNMSWFTYGTLLIFLSYAKIPLNKWYRFLMPLIGILAVFSFIALYVAIKINYV